MKVSIFIRSYHKDIKWLNYCLQSIHKNLKGWDEIVVCIPIGQDALLSHLTAEKVVTCPIYKDDYLNQQISKLQAYKWCQGEYVLFVDSDVMFKPGAQVSDYFYDNKPIIMKADYNSVGDAICWKKPTEKLFRETIESEFMRAAPQLFHKKTLEEFSLMFPNIESYIQEQPYREFSEFNALGYFAYKYCTQDYSIVDVTNGVPEYLPENKSKQFWSWRKDWHNAQKEINEII